jgi:tetrahydromethanopterin S-methyltransferase subunit G
MPSYTWGDDIFINLFVTTPKIPEENETIYYEWELCDKYGHLVTLNTQERKGNGVVTFGKLIKHYPQVWEIPFFPIMFLFSKKYREKQKWCEGCVIQDSPLNYLKFHALEVGNIPEVEQYRIMVQFHLPNNVDSPKFSMARFRITDLEEKADRNWGCLKQLAATVIGGVIGALITFIILRGAKG